MRNSPTAQGREPWTSQCCWQRALTQRGQHGHGHQEQGQEEVKNPHRRVQRQVLLAAAAVGSRLACGGWGGVATKKAQWGRLRLKGSVLLFWPVSAHFEPSSERGLSLVSVSTHFTAFSKVLELLRMGMCAKSIQSCLTPSSPGDCSPPGSSVSRILQARLLEWVAVPSRGIFPTQGLNLRFLCLLHW